MNLQTTIAHMDKKAEEYKVAADALRDLLKYEGSESTVTSSTTSKVPTKNSGANKNSKPGKASGDKPAGKRTLSPEARAKIAAAVKARHEARKQQSSK